MSEFLFDTDTASRLLRVDRATVNATRKSGPSDIAMSVVTQSELLFGARLRPDSPALGATVRAFLARVTVQAFDEAAAEHHAEIRATVRRRGRAAGAFDLMTAAHARARYCAKTPLFR